MKLTGERPLQDQTPPALLALHDAGYREVIARLGPGLVLDVGCGVGAETVRLEGEGRQVLGVDYDPPTAAIAAAATSLGAVCGDGSRLPLRTGAADWVCSSHLIEHFHQPEGHVAELARVLGDDGTAFVITPNAPADFENPYHVHLFEPPELTEMLGRHFHEVEVLGLDGDEVVKADFERRRRTGARLLRLDPFGWRHRLPRSWYVRLHAAGRRLVYPLVNRRASAGPAITDARFRVDAHVDPSTLVLFAVARHPRRGGPAR
jgi:SAM-dependent methyltransferase